MARAIRKTGVKQVPLSEIKDDLSRQLREAESQEIVIILHGKPLASSLVSNRKTTGSSTGSNTILDSCGASNRRAKVCGPGTDRGWKTWTDRYAAPRLRGRPPLRPFSRAAAPLAAGRARPPLLPSSTAIQRGDPKTPWSRPGR